MAHVIRTGAVSRQRQEEAIEFRLLFGLCFVIFLVAAVVARLARPWRLWHREGGRKSIVGEARSAAHTCIPFAFMS